MSGFWLIVRREIRLALRGGTDAAMVVVFFVLAAVLFPFGVGTDPGVLPRIGGGVIWVVALLAAMLSLERMFSGDHEDGSLDQFRLSPVPLGAVALAKALAHWLTTGLPLIAAAPVIAVTLNMPGDGFLLLIAGLALGTPTLTLIGAIGAALTLGARRSGVLVSLLVLPLYVPVLIFGAATVDAAIFNLDAATPLMALAGFLLAAIALAPFAAAAALRLAVR